MCFPLQHKHRPIWKKLAEASRNQTCFQPRFAMRWALLASSTLLVSSLSPPVLRLSASSSTSLVSSLNPPLRPLRPRAGTAQLKLAEEEYKALAGVWRANLELDDGDMTVSLHLAAPPSLSGGGIAPGGGRVYPMESALPFNICQGADGSSSARWAAEHREEDELCLSLQLGNLYLEGRGERRGLRCSDFSGTVFEGGEDPCVIGRFGLRLSLPLTTDMSALEERYRERVASRRPPPISYPRASFVDRWRLLLSLDDDDAPPAYFPIALAADGTWQSEGVAQALGGTWGMHARGDPDGGGGGGGGWTTVESAGESMWLRVHRERSSETLRGLADLSGVRSEFALSGQPVLETPEADLAARIASSSADGAHAPSSLLVDRVDGRLWEGAEERTYFGRFSLLRGCAVELTEDCDAGDDVACTALSREEEAKRAWLAKLDAPTVREACNTGDDVACTALSREEEAKSAWLAKLDEARVWGPAASSSY